MHRLVVRAVEEFLRDTYGANLWRQVEISCAVEQVAAAAPAGRLPGGAERMIAAAGAILEKPEGELYEDLGAWLARREAIRRLLRFSGRDFADFVLSLEELPDRAHFVIPDLEMPRIRVEREEDGTMRLLLDPLAPAWCAILGGLLRAMADDYGALGLVAVGGRAVQVQIPEASFAEGRDFHLEQGDVPNAAGLR
ncbi:heme NO-binding domain-containing protein [Paracoccus marinaquae]|uniref:Heme NO-binding domain-containing protein n=1 Tax=Paracoccus marinaquae TaxID=2841926 RepID=A0ABS6AFL8_9RHOB|nr:heme NO-binding domain-containing protein [Paracoccus marinaquae]MBU3029313.1 heme NO-binding domain-containing protein [Paracoccus marinaquae]